MAQATREAEDRPLRAVIIVGDAFHDDPDGLATRRDDGLPERRRAGLGKAAYAVVPDPTRHALLRGFLNGFACLGHFFGHSL
jgi:hypothetical protein